MKPHSQDLLVHNLSYSSTTSIVLYYNIVTKFLERGKSQQEPCIFHKEKSQLNQSSGFPAAQLQSQLAAKLSEEEKTHARSTISLKILLLRES
jgi:hypothetical protein